MSPRPPTVQAKKSKILALPSCFGDDMWSLYSGATESKSHQYTHWITHKSVSAVNHDVSPHYYNEMSNWNQMNTEVIGTT